MCNLLLSYILYINSQPCSFRFLAVIQAQAAADIITLKEDLIKAQKVRDQKLEYDRVAREIMKFDTRDTYAE